MRVRGLLARFGRQRDGIASLEFVLILFPMMLILFGVIQIGGAFYYYHQMQNAARDTARRMATDLDFHPENGFAPTVLCSAAAVDTAEEYGCDIVTVPGAVDIAAGYCFDRDPESSTPLRWDAVVQMTVPLADASLVDLLGIAGPRTITATAVVPISPIKVADLTSGQPGSPPFGIFACPLGISP
ncbi:MAG: TadE/TadG family type IV pilus assembly protein [Pseudomonadota bacterium]